ncbi:12859_t:CDS:1, partial [Racocetra persica]
EAKQQARADLAYHEEHECGHNLEKPKIAIYFSPNQGGNKHADLTYATKINESELSLEQDNQGQIYQEKSAEKSPINLTP